MRLVLDGVLSWLFGHSVKILRGSTMRCRCGWLSVEPALLYVLLPPSDSTFSFAIPMP
jgi:hypothetical protein